MSGAVEPFGTQTDTQTGVHYLTPPGLLAHFASRGAHCLAFLGAAALHARLREGVRVLGRVPEVACNS